MTLIETDVAGATVNNPMIYTGQMTLFGIFVSRNELHGSDWLNPCDLEYEATRKVVTNQPLQPNSTQSPTFKKTRKLNRLFGGTTYQILDTSTKLDKKLTEYV